MSFPSLFASTNGRGNASTSNSNTHLNSYSYSVTSPAVSMPASTSPGPGPSKPRQKSRTQSRLKVHTTDSRSKSKAKAESKPKGSALRRVKRDMLLEAPDIDTTTRGSNLRSQQDTSTLDLRQGQHVDDYLDETEDDETEGEAETDRDTEAAPDTSVDAEASHRTLIVDPFSAEEERIITVLSRKLEQLRESETTSTSPLSPIEASSPPVPLPLSPDPIVFGQSQPLGTLPAVPLVAGKPSDNRGRLAPHSSTAPRLVTAAGKGKTPSHKHSPKRISPPPLSTTNADIYTLHGGDNGDYPTARAPSHEFAHSRTSSVDSGIYALSPSPVPSSPSSVYAAPTALPVNYRNGSVKANASTRINDNKAISNGHAVPIAVNGKGSHHDDDSGAGSGIPIEFNNIYNRTYGAHISTLSSPEMSLSASPCETYDTRWMGTKANPNGIGFATANGNTSFLSDNINGKARAGRLQTTQAQSYELESGSQTEILHAFMQENEQLKRRIADMEGNHSHLARLNEAYRVELIEYRRRLGLSVDNLIGLSSDPPVSLSPPPRFTSTSTYPNTQGPHTYRHQHHPPSSALGNAFNSNHAFINSDTSGRNAYHSPSNSTSLLNLPTTRRTGANYLPSRSDYIPNEIGYENGLNGAGVTENGLGMTSRIPSTTSTNGVPIPRPPSQVNRHKQLPMMAMPMSVPNTGDPLLYMHGSTSRTVNESQTLSTSASSVPSPSYSSPPYSNNSPALFSPSYSSHSAASSSAASSSAASSASTNVTSPPSSLSFTMMMMLPPTFGVPSRGLSYPLVPPPSLSSSLGSGSGFSGGASGNLSPVEPSGPSVVSRRGSNAGMGIGRRGSFTSGGAVGSVGGRAMDAGSLRRSRGGSLSGHVSWPETVDETEGGHTEA